MSSTNPQHRWHIFILIGLTLTIILPGLINLPVIDRDEARFAQASVQMAETNDLLNIRFKDEARNKKPAAAYWAQTAMIEIFSRDGQRRIWVQRLPSLLAAVLSVLALYWGASRLIGRDGGFFAAILLAISTIFIFESQIAKTDALLCASTTVMLACLLRLRDGATRREVWLFWIAAGLSIMIKGPIGPILILGCLASLLIWDRTLNWARPLLHLGAIVLFILIWLPWGIAIYVATDGAFFLESLGNDFGNKVISEQEGHGLPPGAHSAFLSLTLWPASLFLLPGLFYAVTTARAKPETRQSQAMRLALCWAVPFLLLIELMPTKLPHYILPIFPAFCVMMGTCLSTLSKESAFLKTRILAAFIFVISTGVMIAALLYIQSEYGSEAHLMRGYIVSGASGIIALIAIGAFLANDVRVALGATTLSALVFFTGLFGWVLPNMSNFQTSERVFAEMQNFAPELPSDKIHSPHYREPSLVYHIGQNVDFTARAINLSDGSTVILNSLRIDAEETVNKLSRAARQRGRCLKRSQPVRGFNYSKGTPLNLIILREGPC